jgi:hypothetical protein
MPTELLITDEIRKNEAERVQRIVEEMRNKPRTEFREGYQPKFRNDSEPVPDTIDNFEEDENIKQVLEAVCGDD